MIHGFFVQMGGFVIEGKRGDLKVLHPRQLDLLHRAKQIHFPVITTSELSDRSKGDAVSKALVLVQTSWFIAQCIARHVAGLSITPLEISTLSFCALNGVMYFLWWEKPLDARVPVQVRIRDSIDSISIIDMDWAINGDLLPAPQHWDTISSNGFRDDRTEDVASRATREAKLSDRGESASNATSSHDIYERTERNETSSNTSTRQESLNRLISCADYKVLNTSEDSTLAHVILFPYRRLQEMRGSLAYMTSNDDFTVRMPTYYAYPGTNNIINHDTLMIIFHIIGLLISSGFGSIHIASWQTAFPTSVEMMLWRAATLTIIGAPLIYGIPMIVAVFLYPSVRKTGYIQRQKTPCYLVALAKIYQIVWMFIYILPAIYIMARLFLLVEAVLSLRGLPTSAFLTISWTKYVPHI